MFYGESKLVVLSGPPKPPIMAMQPAVIKSPITGSFALVDLSKEAQRTALLAQDWYICREYFHAVNKGRKRWLYAHRVGYSYKIASFIHEVEKRLHLKEYTVFGPTQMKRISWIELSSFWLEGSMRRSLFTILLRAADKYDPFKNNFLECVQSQKYLSDTMFAFDRFMRGYTKYTGHVTGWYRQFKWGGPLEERIVLNSITGRKLKYKIHTKTLESQVKRLLVKPTI